jgi:Protein of unknown function (DUF3592)
MTPDWHHFWRYLTHFQHFFFIFIGGGTIALRRWWQKIRENRAAGWPSADGVIQSATVRSQNGYWVEINYRYYALQEYRYGKYRRHFRRKAPAEDFAAVVRGRSLQVRYREDNPSVSVLKERDLELIGALQPR